MKEQIYFSVTLKHVPGLICLAGTFLSLRKTTILLQSKSSEYKSIEISLPSFFVLYITLDLLVKKGGSADC